MDLERIELHETSVVGTPAYGRAVVKSGRGFANQVKKSIGENMIQKNEEIITPTEKVEEKIETPTPKKEVEVKTEVPEKVTEEKQIPEKEDNADKDEATTKAVSKAVEAGIEKYVKTASFDKLVEKTVEKIISKKATKDDTKKFPKKDINKDKNLGELGASFMATKENI